MSSFRKFAGNLKNTFFYKRALNKYKKSSAKSYYLDDKLFDNFVKNYETTEAKAHWDYSDDTQIKLANERYKKLIAENGNQIPETVCEIGPGSGRLLEQFIKNGSKTVFGVDIQQPGDFLDKRIKYYTKGVHQMDEVLDNSVDFMYSIDAFEHIPNPVEGLKNCLKKLKPGGTFYLQVGPTYYSPWGFHFYHILKIPYIHILFSEKILMDYAKKVNKTYPWTNKVPASEYMLFFNNLPADIQLLNLRYDYMWYTSKIISKFPHVFKAKPGVQFDDYFIGAIYVKIKKWGADSYLK